MKTKRLKTKLPDCYGDETLPVFTATVEITESVGIDVSLDCCENCNQGGVVWIENREGVPFVCIWADSESEDPTWCISLEGAMRKDTTP